MEEAGIQPDTRAGIPSSGIHQQQQQQLNGGVTMGQFAALHLLRRAPAGPLPAQLQATAAGMATSGVSQLDQLLAGALQQPGFQGLSGLLATAPKRRSSLQDQLFLNSLEQQRQNSRRMEGQRGRGGLSHHHPLASTPAPSSHSLMASIYQHEASLESQHLVATLRMQYAQQLIAKTIQGGNGSNASWGA